jgi:protein ImuB
MKRFVSVWLPMLAIDRMRWARRRQSRKHMAQLNGSPEGLPENLPENLSEELDEQCFVLVRSGAQGLTVTDANARALSAGIKPGQSLADARAAIPGIVTQPAEPERDRGYLRMLAHAAGRYGPARNVEGRDGLWVEITGVAHLFDGEQALARDFLARLNKAGCAARLGIADTQAAAFALARYAPAAACQEQGIAIAPAHATAAALARLPVAALRLDARTVTLLQRLGLNRIGQLYDLPRATLERRFRDLRLKGAARAAQRESLAAAVVMRLDQALGQLPDPRPVLVEPPAYIVRRSYPDMLITSEGIGTACRDLADELCEMMTAHHKGARRLRLALYRADGGMVDSVIGTSRPCRAPEHLVGLFRERLDAGFGIDMMTLEARQVEELSGAQTRFAGHGGAKMVGREADGPSDLVDRLANRIGHRSVFQLESRASHIPECAQQRVSYGAAAMLQSDLPQPDRIRKSRPAFLFSSPEPITVMAEIPEGAPARFTWRRVLHRIVKAEGPERIAPEWWQWLHYLQPHQEGATPALRMQDAQQPPPVESAITTLRDYYCLEDTAGTRYWVFRAGLYQGAGQASAPAWFMHGLAG